MQITEGEQSIYKLGFICASSQLIVASTGTRQINLLASEVSS